MEQNISSVDIVKLLDSVDKIEKKWEKKNSKSINLIQSMAWSTNTREEAHSRILADLLKIPFIKESFMNDLLKDFGGINNCDTYDVKTEEGKVDVQLYSEKEKKRIIIENKINAATEQPNQIARYVFDFANRDKQVEFKDIYVVYLNPDTHSLPSEQSLTLNGKNVFDSIPGHFMILSYKDDITNWLKEIKKTGEAQEEPLLMSALEQYIYYLEVKFKNTDMDREIKDKIDEILHLEGKDFKRKLDVVKDIVNNQIPNFNKWLSDYKTELANEAVVQWLNEIEQFINEKHIDVELNKDNNNIDIRCYDNVWFVIRTEKAFDFEPIWIFSDSAVGAEEKDWHTDIRESSINKCKKLIEKAELMLDADYMDKQFSPQALFYSRIQKETSVIDLFMRVYNAARDLNYIH